MFELQNNPNKAKCTLPFSKPVKSDHNSNFWYFQNNHINTTKKLQSDPVLIRPKLASVLIRPDPVLIRAHLWYPGEFSRFRPASGLLKIVLRKADCRGCRWCCSCCVWEAEVCMDWISDFWTRTPAASGRIRIQVLLTRTGSGLD